MFLHDPRHDRTKGVPKKDASFATIWRYRVAKQVALRRRYSKATGQEVATNDGLSARKRQLSQLRQILALEALPPSDLEK